jgi:hypothetical protein
MCVSLASVITGNSAFRRQSASWISYDYRNKHLLFFSVPFVDILAVYSENHIEPTNAFRRRNVQLSIVKAGGTTYFYWTRILLWTLDRSDVVSDSAPDSVSEVNWKDREQPVSRMGHRVPVGYKPDAFPLRWPAHCYMFVYFFLPPHPPLTAGILNLWKTNVFQFYCCWWMLLFIYTGLM